MSILFFSLAVFLYVVSMLALSKNKSDHATGYMTLGMIILLITWMIYTQELKAGFYQ